VPLPEVSRKKQLSTEGMADWRALSTHVPAMKASSNGSRMMRQSKPMYGSATHGPTYVEIDASGW